MTKEKVIQVKQKALARNAEGHETYRPVILVTLSNGQQQHGHDLEINGPSRLVYRQDGNRHTVRLVTEAPLKLTNWEQDRTYEL